MKTYLIFIIQAYQEFDKVTGQVKDLCTIEVINKTADMAIAQAKNIIKKKFYRISSVIEKEINEHGTN